MIKILSFQPCSLYQNGGASRVLRRLYHGKENMVSSIAVVEYSGPKLNGEIAEQVIKAFPLQKGWMRWKVRSLITWLRHNIFYFWTIRKIREAASKRSFDVIHLVNHGTFSSALCTDELLTGKQLWVSFHDHFSTASTSFSVTRKLWINADRRFVISAELGQEYSRLFGEYQFETITDGIANYEISIPSIIDKSQQIIVYFSGLLHIDYYPLFKILADALDVLSEQGFSFKLVMRGVRAVEFLTKRNFVIEYRSDFISDKEIKKEMDAASILYLPIKFTLPDFYLYSLSTKMVGYLGGSGTILYHGPSDSAACNLLKNSRSGVCCTSLELDELIISIQSLIDNNLNLSANAKILSKNEFNLEEMQKIFWGQGV